MCVCDVWNVLREQTKCRELPGGDTFGESLSRSDRTDQMQVAKGREGRCFYQTKGRAMLDRAWKKPRLERDI